MRIILSIVFSCISFTYGFTSDSIKICSYNIKFLGSYKNKQNDLIAELLKPYDLIVVQELVDPPLAVDVQGDGELEDKADAQSLDFFEAMEEQGLRALISPRDTMTKEDAFVGGSGSEWFVAFYRPERIGLVPIGYIDQDTGQNASFDRVPYAFGVSAHGEDFILISVHLHAPAGGDERRKQEMLAIADWVDHRTTMARYQELDYYIIGDCNFQDAEEIKDATPEGWTSMNAGAIGTTNTTNKPYDHVFYQPAVSPEAGEFAVIDHAKFYRDNWDAAALGEFPPFSDPDNASRKPFDYAFSDHKPIVFEVAIDGVDDD